MQIRRILLHHFRVYQQRIFSFSQDFNIIEGPNARGKTAVLEAIYLAAVGASFRSSHLSELVQRGQAAFSIDIDYITCEIEQRIKVCGDQKERLAYVNGTRLNSLTCLLGGMRAVIFTPEDRALVKGAPQIRRQYLDLQISQTDPLYTHHLKRYARAIKQRNCLLKMGRATTLDSWEFELAHAGAYLIAKRASLVSSINNRCALIYKQLSGRDNNFSIHYHSSPALGDDFSDLTKLREQLRQSWQSHRQRDSMTGMTSTGPHRDELLLSLDDLELRHYGSEGEKRSAAAALRLAEWEEMASLSNGEKPILLIDDLSLGLDAQRERLFANYLSKTGQVFITTAQPLAIGEINRELLLHKLD